MEATTYTLIRELSQQDNWNLERVIFEIDAKRGTFFNKIMKDVSSMPNKNDEISLRVLKLHRKCFPSPLDSYQSIADEIHLHQGILSGYEYEESLLNKLKLVSSLKELELSKSDSGQLHYLHGLIGYQLTFICKSTNINAPSIEETVFEYKKAHENLITCNDSYRIIALKCAMTSVVIDFMIRPKEDRIKSAEVADLIRSTHFLDNAKEILNAEKCCWKAARNGLVASSILNDKKSCIYFWKALVRAHKQFADLNYGPNGLPSINEDSDLVWFRANVIN